MAVSGEYLQYVLEQLAGLAHLTSRRMFSGVGLYCDGVFFALIHEDTLFFKVDDSNREDYLARNMSAFRPFRDKPELSLSYFAVPADALEEPEELARWARKSIAAAAASARAKAPRPMARGGGKGRRSSGAGRKR